MPTKATYSAGTAYLTVVPSMLGIEDAFKQQVRDMAASVDKDLSKAMSKGLRDAARESEGVGKKAGGDFASAYERGAKQHLNKAWQSLPEPQPDVDLRKWDKSLAKIRAEMKDLAGQRIGPGGDIDHATFDKAIDNFRKQLRELRDSAPANNIQGWFNAADAEKSLGELQRFTTEATRRGGEAGDGWGGAFNTRMEKVLRDGLSHIPKIKIDADSSPAERTLAELQGRMQTLADKRIGIDIDAATAYAEIRAIHSELQKLDSRRVRVDIRTNAHEAAAGMGQLIQQAEQAGRSTQGIGHSASFSMTRLMHLIALGSSLGSIIVPAAMSAAAAIGTVGTAAAAGVSGIGVFALGISGVSDAVKALNKYSNDQAKSENSLNQSQRRLASSTDQVRSAQASLANTRRGIAEGAQDAARRVAEAERNNAEAAQDSARRVADAERNVGEVRRQNARDLAEAARGVRDAQRTVTRAEGDALDVRQQLNKAIADAVRNMAELDTALSRNELEQNKAVTAQMAALEELNRLKENPRATEIELRRAKESYDEQTQRLKELKDEQKQLTEEKRRGVDGDDKVVAARKRIADSDQRVADAREQLSRARERQQETEYQGSRRLADGQRQVADALRAQARQQVDGQRQIADARRAQARQQQDGQYQLAQASKAVEAAKRAEEQAWEKTGIAGGEALNNLKWQMSQLGPEAQHFARFIFGLKGEVQGLRNAAAKPLLPRLEEAIKGLLPYVPALSDYIGRVSTKLGDLAIDAVDSLDNPVWRRFFGYVDQNAVPSLQMMYDVGSNLAQGLISLYLAMTPFDKPVGEGLVNLTRDFAQWAAQLENTQGYQDFLQAVREKGPEVLHFLGETGELLIKIIEAGSPLGTLMLHALTLLADGLNSLPLWVLTGLITAFGLLGLSLSTLSAIMRVKKIKGELSEIFGPRMSRMVTTYAIETGRATDETGRFGRATATAAGMASAAGTRISAMGTAVGGAVTRGFNSARTAAFNTAAALNSRVGFTGAAAAASAKAKELGDAASNQFTKGFVRAQLAVADASDALQARGGLTGVLRDARDQAVGLAAATEVAANHGLNRMRDSTRSAAAAFGASGGLEGALDRTHQRVVGFAAAAEVAARQGLPQLWASASTGVAAFGERTGLTRAVDAASSGIDRVRTAAFNAALAFNGPSGVAGGVTAAGTRVAAFGATAGSAATRGLAALQRGASGLIDALGGPWGIALGGAAIAMGYLTQKSDEQKKKVSDLADALKLLGDAYRETKSVNSTAVKDIIAQSEELQNLIDNASLYGLAVADIAKAAAGESDAQQRVIAALKEKREWYERQALADPNADNSWVNREVEGIDTVIGALEKRFTQTNAVVRAQKALDEAQKATANNLPRLTTAQFALGEKMGLNASRMEALTGLVNVFGDAQSTAAEKADALRKAIELQTGAKISAIEAEEAQGRAMLGLTSTVDQNKASIKSNTEAGKLSDEEINRRAHSLTDQTEEAFNNRDALEAAAGAVRDRYLADIESGMPMEQATGLFRDRIDALITNTKNMGFDEKKARELIAVYGDIDPKVTTVYTTKGFDDVFVELEELQVAQWALKNGVDQKQAWKDYTQNKAQAAAKGWGDGYGIAQFFANGGGVSGGGTGTSDSIPAWLSNGEFVQPAASVDFYGQGFMELLRQRALPRDVIPGFAAGGMVEWPFETNTLMTRIPSMDEVRAAVWKNFDKGTPSGGGIGSADMMRILRSMFPGLPLYSGYRPGSRTPSGNLSYHAMIAADGDKGRAVDLPPRQDVFDFIHDNYFSGTRELIWLGDKYRNIWNGQHHKFSDSLLANHGTAGMPNAHLHWAYDQGGYLPPGVSMVVNGTGKPEPVFTDGQWDQIASLVRNNHAEPRGETHHWHFANHTLDHGRLEAWANQREARARPGRPN